MKTTDLDAPASPEEVAQVLRNAAYRMRELEAAWQDKGAGRIWLRIARELDRAASRVEQIVNQDG